MDSEDNGSQEDQVSKILKPPCYKIIILGESGVGMHDMIDYIRILHVIVCKT